VSPNSRVFDYRDRNPERGFIAWGVTGSIAEVRTVTNHANFEKRDDVFERDTPSWPGGVSATSKKYPKIL
jgi:hypothetical protein